MRSLAATTSFDPADVQGNILRGYHFSRARFLMIEVIDMVEARRWLGAIAIGGEDTPAITSEVHWAAKPPACFNLGITCPGLRALGVSEATIATFPDEFVQGMNARSAKLGDVGASAPEHWIVPFRTPNIIHLIATIHADEVDELDRIEAQVVAAGSGRALAVRGVRDGWNFNGDYVHFGYRDNFSQPRFLGVHDPDAFPDGQPLAPIGSMLLGYPTEYEGLIWTVPQPDVLGRNGSFNAFRILEQDVSGFEAYLDETAATLLDDPLAEELLPSGEETRIGAGLSRHAALREVVAAKMCGRWRNGVPLATSPNTPNPDPPVSMTDFDYRGGANCPFGAHVRRSNPRSGTIVQRAARHTRRLARRGIPYGLPYDPTQRDDQERGLLGSFIGANLGAQFEALSCDWLNLGLQDPRITGSNDPLLGVNVPETSWHDIPLASGRVIKLHGIPRFVRTRGGAYAFLPSIPALKYLASLNGPLGYVATPAT